MHKLARFADARNTAEGKFVAILLSVLLVFSFLNVTMFTDRANAGENDLESSEMTLSVEDVEAEEEEAAVESDTPKEEDAEELEGDKVEAVEGNSAVDADEKTDSLEVEATDSSNMIKPRAKAATLSDEDAQAEENTEAQLPASFDSETGTLKIENVDGLDELTVQSYLKDLGIKTTDIRALVLKNVGDIDRYAFKGCGSNVISVVIDGAGVVGEYAFYMWAKVEEVTILNAAAVGDHAFFKCPLLASVSLENVKRVESNAFSECKMVSSLTLNEIDLVGDESFRQDSALTNLSMSNIKEFGRSPFSYCTGLTSLDLDGTRDGIKTLGTTMFYGCTGLKEITLSNMDSAGYQPFSLCSGLEKVTLDGGLNTWGTSILGNCQGSFDLTVKNIETIPEEAFVGCEGIKSVEIDGVTTVGKNAFASCKSLKNAKIVNVDTVGQYAFYNCTSLDKVEMSATRIIENYAFWFCSKLKTIESLKDVKRIGGFAFYGCSSLTGLTIDDITKMGYVGTNDEIMKRVQAILAGKFKLGNAEVIQELGLAEGWTVGEIAKSDNWNTYDNGTQISEQARWADTENGVAEVKVDAYYTGKKQMDYIFVADLSASMAQLGNQDDSNARFYDMQSKLLDMTDQLLNTPGYDCRVAIVTFGGYFNKNATCKSSGFLSSSTEAAAWIKGLEPLNENTDYLLGLDAALRLAKDQDANRNTAMVFLSDGRPTREGETSLDTTDQRNEYNKKIAGKASELKDAGVSAIYGVLHSPGTTAVEDAHNAMGAVCGEGNYFTSTDTESFGRAMNAAFTGVYGKHTITVPVNDVDFNLGSVNVSAGEYSYNNGVITWTVNDAPFTPHTLTYSLSLTEENANRAGTYRYSLNRGDATFGGTGASVGIDLALSRTVAEPVVVGSYRVVHEYYTNGTLDGSMTETFNAPVGTRVQASSVTLQPVYQGARYVAAARTGSLTVAKGSVDSLVIRYNRTIQAPSEETPTPTPAPNPTPAPSVPNPDNGGNDTPDNQTPANNPTTPGRTNPTPGTTVTPAGTTPTTVIDNDDTPLADEPTDTDFDATVDDAGVEEAIGDDATPMAARGNIQDEDVPLGAFEDDHAACWVHWIMLLGLVATAVYGIAVVRRRLGMTSDIDDFENQIMGRNTVTETQPSTADGRQAL